MNKVATNNGPRTWSSYTNITTKDDRRNFKMNSVENILEYRNLSNTYHSPTLVRKTAATTYDFPELPAKKDKKWSLGSFFRRKKKEESESSSEDEAERKGFLNKKKKKSDKRKKTKHRATFDHVIKDQTSSDFRPCDHSNARSLCF
ncbi:hypothetical protein QE152_g29352 [Popillia japonica]|uniref:Uncharacterized protein n=1 Tax=Popillia japonica TaxID=7064 RepID=A0AAW1JI97_POPJA